MDAEGQSSLDCGDENVTLEMLTWERLEQHFHSGAPCLLSMGGSHGARIGVRANPSQMFVQVEVPGPVAVPPSPYSELVTGVHIDGAVTYFEVYIANPALYREFHQFARLFVEYLETSNRAVVAAFQDTLSKWLEFGAPKALLTADQQLGLLGELSVLLAILKSRGALAVQSWTGRNEQVPDRHDFRLQGVDLEVKSTRASRREHIVHGLKQLSPSYGHVLYVLSLRFAPAGTASGDALATRVAKARAVLAGTAHEAFFEKQLRAAGYSDVDAPHYQERFKMADAPMLIQVDSNCPRLTEDLLSVAVGQSLASRIREVSYRADLEGLGIPQGSTNYREILGDLEVS